MLINRIQRYGDKYKQIKRYLFIYSGSVSNFQSVSIIETFVRRSLTGKVRTTFLL
jgi:hypothetical protein